MSVELLYKMKKDKNIFNTCSKLLETYNSSTNQNLSFEFDEEYVISKTSIRSDILNLFWFFNYHTIDTLNREIDEAILSSYMLGILTSRLKEITYFDKNDNDRVSYVKSFYKLLSNFNINFLSNKENIKIFNEKLLDLKIKFEILHSSWL
jgi:hypothetical protein